MRLFLLCVTLLIVGSCALQIDCEFGMETYPFGDFYSCKAKRLNVAKENDVFDSIIGDHLPGKKNEDVNVFHVDDQSFKYFPADIENFFRNLIGLKVVSSGLKVLTQDNFKWLPDLRFLIFDDNEIDSLNDDLFKFNSRLNHINFDSNKISFIGANLLDPLNEIETVSLKNNECIDEEWKSREEIDNAREKFLDKCSVESSMNAEMSETDYSDGETRVTKITKVTRTKSRPKFNLNGLKASDEPLEVSCELGNVLWQFSGIDLFTCTIMTQTIDQPGYIIKINEDSGKRVEGLSFNNNQNVKILPVNIAAVFPNLIELSVKNSYLETISGKIFSDLQKLKKLSISNNDLQVIENETFAGLSNLEELDLSEGNIRFVEEGAFAGLTSLKMLRLGGNKINYLQAKTFEGLTELRNISLELNHLSDIEENLFSSNNKLANVWLNGNKISILSPKVFEGMPSLGYVDLLGNECIDGVFDASNFDDMRAKLSDNCDSAYIIRRTYKTHKFSSITGATEEFGKVRNEYSVGGDEELVSIIQFADVEETKDEEYPTVDETTEIVIKNKPEDKKVACEFGDVYWHFSQENLKTCIIKHQIIDAKGFEVTDVTDGADVKGLNMGFNSMMKFMPENLADVFPNVVELSVQNSSLVVLSQKNFAGLSNLKTLNLAYNNIKFVDSDAFDDLEDLEELDLSGNSLEYVDENLFIKLKNLKTLRLSDNRLHFLHSKLFRNLRNLQNVSISNNQLSTIDENLFKTNQDLKNVWLQNNKVKSLSPNLFNTANELEYVDLRENKCIDTVYESKAFDAMKSEILKKCGDGYVLKHGKKTTKSAKKNEKKKKKQKNKSKAKEQEIKEVICEYEDVFWPSLNKTMFTCVVSSDQIIDGPGYTISVNANPFALPLIDGFSVQALSFGSNKNIKFLPENISEAFPNLVAMSAAGSDLETVSKKSFGNLKQLKSLDLGQNKIKSFDSDTFEELSSLEELILDDNEFEIIEETTFITTKRLRKLKMAGNKLTFFDPNAFEMMTELVEVSMEFEDPTQVSEEMFKSSKNLKKVNINGKPWGTHWNVEDTSVEDFTDTTSKPTTIEVPTLPTEKTSIAEEVIAELSCDFHESFSSQLESNLFTCELDGSDLTSDSVYSYRVTKSLQLPQVKKLIMKNVRNLPEESLFQIFPALIEFVASNIGLTGVNKKNFEGLNHLKILDLSKNAIKHIESDTFEDLGKAEFIDLSDNNMEFIEETLFFKLNNLKQLHLSRNQLHYIHKKLFRHLTNLEVVMVDQNLLSVVEPFTFRQNQKLQTVDLSHNKIESLNPKTLDNLRELQSVDLTGNKCVSGHFDTTNFDEMKAAIKSNCTTKVIEDSREDESWINCDFDPSDNSCTVSDHSIESSNYRIKIKSDDELISNGQKVEHLTFIGPHIKYLPKSISEVFPNLVEISTIDTSLNSISRENFMNLPKLKSLKMNHIEMFEPDTFEDMTKLENLHVESDVDEIDEATFSKLHNLKVFYYETKNVLTIDPKAFDEMTELVEFNLKSQVSNGDISEIEATVQENNPNLLKLTLNDKVIKDEPLISTTEAFKSSTTAPSTTDNYKTSLPTQPEYLQTSTTDRPRTTRPNVSATTPKPEQRTVTCYLNYTEWSNTNLTLITCNLENQDIDDPETIIKLTPYSDYVEGLKIINNKKVKFLPENIAKSFPNLIQLSAKNSSLETISKEDFENLKKLKTLDLSDNNIESVEPETFNDLEDLEELDLSNNQIDYIDENAFPNLKKLKSLDLRGNKITFLHPKTFEKLSELIKLNLEGNNLPHNIVDDLLKTNTMLVEVKLPSNVIVTENHPEEPSNNVIPCSFSDKLWFFAEANFFSCELKDSINNPNVKVEGSSRNTRVRGLSFIDNKNIKFLPQDLAETLPNLVAITAFNSSLESISPETFKDLRKVRFLNLANNKIKQLEPSSFNDMPELEELDLSNNELQELEESTFEKLLSLKTLYLTGNSLKQLPVNIFGNLQNIRNISLENNKIVKIHPNQFKNNLNLENVWLNGNQLSSLNANTFKALKNLEYVDLQNNICIDKFYEGSKLDQMAFDIDRNCKAAENLIKPVTYRPDTKPSIPKTKEVACDLRYVDWSDDKSSLYTCNVTGDSISSSDVLKPSSPKVQALIIENKKNVNLPHNISSTFPNLQRISIKNSSLTSINPRTFKGLNNKLIRVDLSDNKIDTIYPGTFTNFPLLEEINLDHNRIKHLQKNVFPRSLKFLNVGSNQISSLSPQVFDNLPGLAEINLKHNSISELPEELFKDNRNLEKILFSGNRIRFMSDKTFKNLPMLNAVDFEENECVSGYYDKSSMKALMSEIVRKCQRTMVNSRDEVDTIQQPEYYDQLPNYDYDDQARVDPNESFPKSKKLNCKFSETYSSAANSNLFTCNVESQPIETTGYTFDDNPNNLRVRRTIFTNNEETDFMPDTIGRTFPNLVQLEVQNTSLKAVRPENFDNLRHLKFLDLSGNNLKFIEPETFDDLSSLEQLHLSRNNLMFIAQPKLQSLKRFELDGNQLRFVDSSTFSNLPELVSLNLENNQLTEIDEDLFKSNLKLERVNLRNNKLESIEKEAFSSNVLKGVDLRGNSCLDRLFSLQLTQTIKENVETLCQPLESVKSSLAACQHHIGSCQSNTDSQKLRNILRKAEIKIKQLNAHQKRLKNAVNYEKNLVRKLKQKVKAVEDESEKLKSSPNTCSRLDGLSVQLGCVFEVSDDGNYACLAANLNVGKENTSISEVQGEHTRGKRTADVTTLTIADQSMKSIPHGLASFFANLKEFNVLNSGLTSINPVGFGRMHKLVILIVRGNDLSTIENGSFDDFSLLETLDLSSNNIYNLPKRAFIKLPNLKFIDISNNRVKSLPAEFIPEVNQLHKLSFANNNLEIIDPKHFKSFRKLQEIDFTGNNCFSGQFSSSGGDDAKKMMTFFGEIAVGCVGDAYGVCNAK